jgi:trimethylamine--corrinoid protein Co-methyltransferase
MVGSLMGCSFESMVIDNEAAGMISRTLRGIEVSDETLSVDVIHDCAVDPGHFLGNAQTLKYMETEYIYPNLMDRELTDTWEKDGKQTMFDRARVVSDGILKDHYPNYFGSRLDAELRAKFPIKLPPSAMQPG